MTSDGRLVVRSALAAAWRATRETALHQDEITADAAAFRFSPSGHLGDPALPADAITQFAIELAIDREAIVVGEEVVRTLYVVPGEKLAIVDAVDGTVPLTHLAGAYATAIVLLIRGSRGWELAAAGIVIGSGIVVTIADDGIVMAGLVEDDGATDRVIGGTTPEEDLSVAMVGAKPSDREAFVALQAELRDAVVFNVGGNPLVWGVIAGKLGAIVSTKAQTSWDALYALFIARVDGVVGDLEGNLFPVDALEDLYCSVELEDDAKTIPPLIAAKDRAKYQETLVAVRRARRIAILYFDGIHLD